LDFVGSHIQRWSVPCGDENIDTLFLPRTTPELDEPSNSVASYIRANGLDADIAAIVYPDRRGDGYGIARHEDHPRLDFVRVQEEPDVHFAHKSGFVCKTSASTPERLKELVAKAWLPQA
jgi:hypothetical protein